MRQLYFSQRPETFLGAIAHRDFAGIIAFWFVWVNSAQHPVDLNVWISIVPRMFINKMPEMTPFDTRIMKVAADLAVTSTHPKAMIGAVLVSGRDIIAIGVNGRKSHPMQKYYNRFRFSDERASHLMHAELEAIVRGRTFLRGDNAMYIFRQLRTGTFGMCRPCAGCIRALKDFKIPRIFYTTYDGFASEVLENAI